ncbi:MAG: GTP cyclohydrolase II [Myxococcota bacterium]|nr:GTP cyclohydrolase II [Myxococcota bacterium]
MSAIHKTVEEMPNLSVSELELLPAPDEVFEAEGYSVSVYARASLPTRFGDFNILVFRNTLDDKEHVALVRGTVQGEREVPVRLHSECLTGDVLGSLRCDCRDQLEYALNTFGEAERAVLIYLRQEGRGIGLGNKVRAYTLQEQGLDTYEANQHLGFDDDLRDYRVAALILKVLGIESICLATNNPRKLSGLREHGICIEERTPVVMELNVHNTNYLVAKAQKSGHLLPL